MSDGTDHDARTKTRAAAHRRRSSARIWRRCSAMPALGRLRGHADRRRQEQPDVRHHAARPARWCCAGRRSPRCCRPHTTWCASTASSPRSPAPTCRSRRRHHLCTDTAVVGAPFYVMERINGLVVRDTVPAGYADSPAERSRDHRRARRHADRHPSACRSTAPLEGYGRTGRLPRPADPALDRAVGGDEGSASPATDFAARRPRHARRGPVGEPAGAARNHPGARRFPARQHDARPAGPGPDPRRAGLGALDARRSAGRRRAARRLLGRP